MKFVHFHRRSISTFAILAFTVLLCFWANQSPAAANPGAEKNPSSLAAGGDDEVPGFIEEEAPAPAVKKGKKFPWLIVGAAVVIGAAAVYFLVLKKTKNELTVTLGEGCTGTPAATAKYKKDEVVNYSYSTQAGWGDLQVKLDGVTVAATGTVTMDKAHTLDVSATYGAIVNITSSPAGAKIYDNNSDSGKTTPATFTYTSAGTHTFLLRLCGYQDYSKTQSVVVGQTYDINATMVAGILDNFLVPASCWSPYVASAWTVSGGLYKCTATQRDWDFSYYNSVFGSTKFTVEVKMRRTDGSKYNSTSILLTDGTNLSNYKGYLFNYTASGSYSVWKVSGNWIADTGSSNSIKSWSSSSRINKGLNSWNTMKIVRSGSNYSYYINDSLLTSFSNANYDVRVVVLTFYNGNSQSKMEYDYVKLSPGATAGLMPPDTIPASIPVPGQKHSGIK
ncbi:MAG: PEGA domain-containing protein [Candidatus Aminicenantes bacterium]|nr:PEGA domain-containing protein [Candidatus Aminicenantes bacterium]